MRGKRKKQLEYRFSAVFPGRRPTKAVLKAMEAGATPQEAVYKVLLAKGEGRINGPQSSGEW